MEQIVRVIIAFLVVGAVLTLIERLFPARRGKRILRRAVWLDLQFLVFAPTVGKALTRVAILLAIAPAYWLLVGDLPDREALMAGFGPVAAQPAWRQAIELLLHANVDWDFGRLRMVIASPVFHRWRHSRDPAAIDRNFAGLFPVRDLIFGTWYMPRDRMPCDFGVHEPTPDTLRGQLAYPFRR